MSAGAATHTGTDAEKERGGATAEHLRGSSLLLFGRLVALVLNFAVQVVAVRYLAKAEYGAFAFALSAVAVGANASLLGLGKALGRFAPMYDERREHDALRGAIWLALAAVVGLGVSVGAAIWGLSDLLAERAADPRSIEVLLAMVALVPLQAVDSLCETLAAAFAGARAIFFRRQVLTPLLRLAAVLLVTLGRGDARALAWCYVAAGLVGVGAYLQLLARAWKRTGFRILARGARIELRPREIFGYALPVFTSNLCLILVANLGALFLGSLRGPEDVATLRAVVPLAGLNLVVFQSFRFLFVPLAARLVARGDTLAVGDLYWRSTTWIAVLTFPVLGVTLFLAEPLTLALFGQRYSGSVDVLRILAVGNYVDAALGLNAHALQVFARLRWISGTNLVVALVAVLANALLTPVWGVVGAALAWTGSIVLVNVLNQIGLALGPGLAGMPADCRRAYVRIAGVTAAMALLSTGLPAGPWTALITVTAGSGIVLATCRGSLWLADTFPRLSRHPFGARLFGGERPA